MHSLASVEHYYIDGLVQNGGNSSAEALELPPSFSKPWI